MSRHPATVQDCQLTRNNNCRIMHHSTHTNTYLQSGTPVSSKLAHMLIQLKETESTSVISPLVIQDHQVAKHNMQLAEVIIYVIIFYTNILMIATYTLVSTKSIKA